MCLYNFIFMYEFQIDKTDEEKKNGLRGVLFQNTSPTVTRRTPFKQSRHKFFIYVMQ